MENENNRILLIKYGGNAMIDESLKKNILKNVCSLQDHGYKVVIVHGGGPFIKEALEEAKIESEFIDGHRKTSTEALKHVEVALKGNVNSNLVKIINSLDHKAVGLSGKDGKIALAKKRMHTSLTGGVETEHDLGQVGDVVKIDTKLLFLLLDNGYIPVLTCIASDENGEEYNINADMFAGNVAGALSAEEYIVLTDVDGLMMDIHNPESIITELKITEIDNLIENQIIAGGMIPKIESCTIALEKGAKATRIINGTKPDQILSIIDRKNIGTLIKR